MAPKKRSLAPDNVETVDVQEASSSLRQDRATKRVRVSLDDASKDPTPQPDDISSDGSESASDNDDNDDGPQSPPRTQYELQRDDGFRHLANPDADDLQATQKIAQRATRQRDNTTAESGVIESVTCINFMCHERLHVELGPLINFIVGENGSGKSAVLTALTLCLGGKASDTNRGGSLRSFIKEGRDHSTLIVQIKNAGTDAYQPDVYGESIIVERHFSKGGASGFKVKSALGRTISTKKQEVDEISEWYALQMGNPLTVLSQDNARQFLNSSSPAQKYRYFLSGVQLEQLDNDYKLSQDTLERTEIVRHDLNEKVEVLKREMEDAARLSETASKNETIRQQTRIYRLQLAWSQVVGEEEKLEQLNQDLKERDDRIIQCEERCQEMTEALTAVEEKLQQVTHAREQLDEDRDGFEDKINSATAVYDDARKELADLQREERDAYGRLKTAKTDIKSWEEKIEDEERRLGESTGPERATKDSELAEAQMKEKHLNEQLSEAAQEMPNLLKQKDEAGRVLKTHGDAIRQKRREILEGENRASDLKQSTGSPYDGFEPEVKRLVNAIEEDGSFTHKPIGPLGAHVRLLKPEWSGILERTFGEGLNAFVVKSKADQSKLAALIRRLGMRRVPQIYIAYGGNIDTRAQEPDASFDTILRVLEFDSDVVRSQLIINYQIEKIILVKNRVEAENIMVDNDQPPRNVSACLCFHDGQGKRNHGLRITNRGGTASSSPMLPFNQRPRMRTDSGRQLQLQKEHVKQLGLELRELMSEERQAKQSLQRCNAQLEANKEETKKLNTQLRQTQADIERISMELDAFEGVDSRLEVLRADLVSKQEEAERLGNQYGAMALAKRDLVSKVDEAKSALSAVKLERDDYQSRINKASSRLQSVIDMRRIAISKKNDAFERLDIEKNERRRAEGKKERQAAVVEDFIIRAKELSPDRVFIPEGETYQSIRVKYEKLREQIRQRESRLGANDKEIHDRAAAAKKRYDEVMREARRVDQTNASLKKAIDARLHLWRHFQRQISARVRIQFTYLLSERGFRGKIEFDHKNKTVQVQVEPDETRRSSAGRNTKTLSGGEKSFSSICMLLSIWEAIASPIRCLDEFDVFMDNVNRAISTNMLVDAARLSVSRQYILITPNAIEGHVDKAKDVHIVRLTDPRQRTLV